MSSGNANDGGISRNKDGVPQWAGDPSTFQQYEEEARLWEQTQAWHKRHMAAPRLKAELQGAARRLILGQPATFAAHDQGVDELLQFLRLRLGKAQMPELSEWLNRYFRSTKRKAQETIGEYITRKCEVYVRAQQSLQRVQQDQGPTTPARQKSRAEQATTWNTWSRRTSLETLPEEGDSGSGPQAAAPTSTTEAEETPSEDWQSGNDRWSDSAWNGTTWSWAPSWGQSGWGWSGYHWYGNSSYQGSDTRGPAKAPPEILPDFVQGWFLLQDAGLDVHERNVIQTALQGDFGLQRVAAELRAQWPDHEVQKRDRGHRHGAYDAEAMEDDHDDEGSPDLAWLAEEGLGEEGLALMSEAEASAQAALAAINHGRRTLKEARARQHEVRMARRYYRTSGEGRSVPSNSQGRQGKPGGPRDDSHLTCLKCGKLGHRVANCPDRGSEQAKVVEEAPFVCFAGSEEAMACGITTEEAMRSGKAVVDGGATKTIASVTALEALMENNRKRNGTSGVHSLDPSERPIFSFGNSTSGQCLSTAHVNIRADSRAGRLKIHALNEGSGPILLSIATLRSLGAVIDFEHDLAVFRHLDCQRAVPLERSNTGHQLLSLSEDIFKDAIPLREAMPSIRERC